MSFTGGLTVSSAPSVEPLTLDEAIAHLRVEDVEEGPLIESLIQAARQKLEREGNTRFITQTLVWTLDRFPRSSSKWLQLPDPPLQSIGSIGYIDTNGDAQTWSSSEYTVDASSTPGRVRPAYGYDWPNTLPELNAVTITFDAGYGDDGDNVPTPVLQAMRLLLGHYWLNREAVVAGTIATEIPLAVADLFGPYCFPDL